MGGLLAKLSEALREFTSGGDPSRVLMLGLDAAGKTTILYKVRKTTMLYKTVIFIVFLIK